MAKDSKVGQTVSAKDWKVGQTVLVSENVWTCDIIRVEDSHVVKKVLLTPETLPPRLKGKKVVWKLPTDGSIPKFGLFEQERIIAIFKESRKKNKKDKKPKDEIETSGIIQRQNSDIRIPTSASLLMVKVCASWYLRSLFKHWQHITSNKQQKQQHHRYSVDELLKFRSNIPVVSSKSAEQLFSSVPSVQLDTFFNKSNSVSINKNQSGNSQDNTFPPQKERNVYIPPSSQVQVQGPPGLQQPLQPPGLVQPPAQQHRNPLNIAPPAIPSSSNEEEQIWKQNWKEQYLARLETLAETAWQNHLQSK